VNFAENDLVWTINHRLEDESYGAQGPTRPKKVKINKITKIRNNGYYSDRLELIVSNRNDFIKTFDISECQDKSNPDN